MLHKLLLILRPNEEALGDSILQLHIVGPEEGFLKLSCKAPQIELNEILIAILEKFFNSLGGSSPHPLAFGEDKGDESSDLFFLDVRVHGHVEFTVVESLVSVPLLDHFDDLHLLQIIADQSFFSAYEGGLSPSGRSFEPSVENVIFHE